jgi:parvulin-like peptidyl-prolyl isomerase
LYRDRNQSELDPQVEPLVRRQVLENLIRQRLLGLDSRRRGIQVSEAEADAQLRRDPVFQQNGSFNEAKYLAIKGSNPTGFAQAMASVKEVLAARKMSEQMERETRPDDAAIRAEIERQLTRASIDYLALRRRDFDGRYAEPREAEIHTYYAASGERYRRPEQAVLSVILVDRPAMSDLTGATDSGFRAWEQRMRSRADSARAAIRAGAKFADLASLHGGMKTGITLRRDRLPDFWRGDPRDLAAVFAAAPGTVLSEPVRAGSGWALVRVDAVEPSHIAPVGEVAREIRRDLRSGARWRLDDHELRLIYEAARDSLRGDGYRLRYALADTASFAPGEPTPQDLDRFYRAHLADYSAYDKVSGTVVEKPLAAVRDEIRRRWREERRRQLARGAAERLRDAWSHGRRDAASERSMALVREIGPVPAGGPVDIGPAGQDLAEALAKRGGQTGVTMITTVGGYLVYDLREVVAGYVPTFEQARPLLAPRLDPRRAAADEAVAKAAFEKDPAPYRLPGTLVFTRILVKAPPLLDVELSRDEVERYHRAHLNQYSVQELVRVRHILISPTGPGPDADAAARRKAEDVLKRVRGGEDFAKLAGEFSDDPATRENGGDVGVFGHGQMREGFERAAFAMRPGDITGPVRTEVGYHLMECLEYLPPIIHPIATAYANVAYACARKKADRLASERADSLYRTLKSVADAKAVARRLNLETLSSEHRIGRLGVYDDQLLPYIKKVETLKPGQLYPGTQFYEGLGQVITWVDSIVPARLPTWEEAKGPAVERSRRQAGQLALIAKQAELDSMRAGGWSFDSLATLWGGLEKFTEAPAGSELRGLGGKALLDSLVFGRERAPVLEPGQVSDWIEFPGGYSKLRIAERLAPDSEDLARRVELRRQLVLWRKLNQYFDRLKARYPVEILDGELRATALPEPTET